MTRIFSAVADDTRRKLLNHLRQQGPLSIKQLTADLPMTRQAVTKHLGILSDAGLVVAEFRGREKIHRLTPEPLREVDEWLRPYAEAWDRRLDRLQRHLEEES